MRLLGRGFHTFIKNASDLTNLVFEKMLFIITKLEVDSKITSKKRSQRKLF